MTRRTARLSSAQIRRSDEDQYPEKTRADYAFRIGSLARHTGERANAESIIGASFLRILIFIGSPYLRGGQSRSPPCHSSCLLVNDKANRPRPQFILAD